MRCTLLVLSAIMREHGNSYELRLQKGNGERWRLARRAWRPAGQIFAKERGGVRRRAATHHDREARTPVIPSNQCYWVLSTLKFMQIIKYE